jgi:CubicO group peptidase (beta-lactamase class C family)
MYSFSKFLLLGLLTGTALSSTDKTAQAFNINQSLQFFNQPEVKMTSTSTANLSPEPVMTAESVAEMEAYLNAYAQTGKFSGSVTITQGLIGGMTHGYDLANREHQVANTGDTKFRIGSVTKQFTAVAILQLQEKGLLDVQAPVSTYLSDYPNGDLITIHHLLTHTAGIPEYLDPETFPDLAEWMRQSSSLAQLVDRFKDLPLEFEPGEKFKYSNSGYVLLTQIIETVAEQPYAEYLQANVFAPLGMKDTGYEVPQTVISNLAQGYLFIGKETYLQASPLDMSIPQGAGGLYSTAEDLSNWNRWLYVDEGSAVLSRTARAMMMRPIVQMEPEENPDTFYGYGLVIDNHLGRQRVHHNGGISGFASSLAYYPDEALSIVALSNFETALPSRIAEDLAAIAFNEPYEIPTQPEAITLDPAIYEKYTGTYQLLPEMQIAIRVENGELTAQATGQGSFVLYPTSETEFFAEIADITVMFSLSDAGIIEGLTLRQMGQELFAPKIEQ